MSVQSVMLPVFWVSCHLCGAQSHELVDAPLSDLLAIEEAVARGYRQANNLNFYCPECAPHMEACS